jgi:hypothetical protein
LPFEHTPLPGPPKLLSIQLPTLNLPQHHQLFSTTKNHHAINHNATISLAMVGLHLLALALNQFCNLLNNALSPATMVLLHEATRIWFLPCVAVLSFLGAWYIGSGSSGKQEKPIQHHAKPLSRLPKAPLHTLSDPSTSITIPSTPLPKPAFGHYLAADYSGLKDTAPENWRTLREGGWLDQQGTPTKKWFGGKGNN